MRIAPRCFVLLTIFVISNSSAVVSGQEANLEHILQKWRERNAKIRKIEYVLDGKVAAAKDSLTGYLALQGKTATGSIPPEDMTVDAPGRVLLDFDRSCARIERRMLNLNFEQGTCEPFQTCRLFDGTTVQSLHPRAVNAEIGAQLSEYSAELFVENVTALQDFFQHSETPLLLAHGLVLHRKSKRSPVEINTGDLPTELNIHATDAQLNGQPHIILRSTWMQKEKESYYEYWVDPAKDCAISRLNYFSQGFLKLSFDIHYQQVEGNWLPANWKEVEFARNQQTINWRTVTVTRCTLKPAFEADAFHVTPRSGTIVQDNTRSQDRVVLTPRTGEAEVIINPQWVRSRETQRWWVRGMIATAAVVALIAGALFFRFFARTTARIE